MFVIVNLVLRILSRFQNANNQTTREFKAMLSKRDDENVRLREQRDQLSAEIQERKQKDFIKYSAAQEYKGLWESSTVS